METLLVPILNRENEGVFLKSCAAALVAISAVALTIIGGCVLLDKYHKATAGVMSVSIGMPIQDIEKNSEIPLGFKPTSSPDGYADYHEDVIHQLRVVSGELYFTLPNMRSVAMQAMDGKLHRVDDRPSSSRPFTSLMSLDEALRWSESVISVVDNSGWKRDADRYSMLYSGDLGVSFASMAKLRQAFLDRKLEVRLRRVRVATWKHGNDVVNLEVARVPLSFSSPAVPIENILYFTTISVERNVEKLERVKSAVSP